MKVRTDKTDKFHYQIFVNSSAFTLVFGLCNYKYVIIKNQRNFFFKKQEHGSE